MGLFADLLNEQDRAERHSPFIRAVLGPMAGRVEPARDLHPNEQAAANLLALAVETAPADPEGSLDLLYRSANLGLVPAITMLGAELWLRAVGGRFPADEEYERALEGLGWLQHAADLGDEKAADFLTDTLAKLPEPLWERWLALPAHFPFVVQ